MSSKPPIDQWTVAHFLAGVGSGMFKIKLKDWIFFMLAFELFEQGVMTKYFPDWHEPPENVVMDILIGAAGNKLAKIKKF